ncbi:MAG: hypothetical protein EB120_10915 [Proteobacteria bacterium]|nr:hypothetical protein [Pseudomonadota bacterium]
MSNELVKFHITYNQETKTFTMTDSKGRVVSSGASGKKLGKEAWKSGADVVCYDYDLRMDEN